MQITWIELMILMILMIIAIIYLSGTIKLWKWGSHLSNSCCSLTDRIRVHHLLQIVLLFLLFSVLLIPQDLSPWGNVQGGSPNCYISLIWKPGDPTKPNQFCLLLTNANIKQYIDVFVPGDCWCHTVETQKWPVLQENQGNETICFIVQERMVV